MSRLLLLTVLGLGLSVPAFAQSAGGAPTASRGQDSGAQLAIRQAERDRHDAMLRGDVQALSRLVADDYVGTGAHGRVRTKAQVLADYSSGAVKYESITEDDVTVRVYGTAALVMGRTHSKGKESGKTVDTEHRFTRVWIQEQGRWQLVASQSSPIAGR